MKQMPSLDIAANAGGERLASRASEQIDFVNGQILLAGRVAGEASIVLENGRIVAVGKDVGAGERIDLGGGWLVPGFIDTQVNGGGGVLFNDTPSAKAIAVMGAAHSKFGTTGFLPTLISPSPEQILQALDALDEALDAGVPGCLGVHVEGPAINEKRRGIHGAAKLRDLDDAVMERLMQPRAGKVMVTLAPERTGLEQIAQLVAAGVIVSIGHSDCDYETARAAFAAGATGVTHLFNAMSALHHRAPGLVGAVLENRQVWSGLIVDGEHLHPAALRIALAARPHDRLMLVTDAMPSVGSDMTSFVLEGQEIAVVDGRCLGADGTLAGASLDMAGAVRNTVQQGEVSVPEAVAMASANPAAFLGMERLRGTLAPGFAADFVQLTPELACAGTWIGGARVA